MFHRKKQQPLHYATLTDFLFK